MTLIDPKTATPAQLTEFIRAGAAELAAVRTAQQKAATAAAAAASALTAAQATAGETSRQAGILLANANAMASQIAAAQVELDSRKPDYTSVEPFAWRQDASGWTIPVTPGRAFYIDPVAGSDSAAGTSESTAHRTLGPAMKKLAAGDAILIRSGATIGHFPGWIQKSFVRIGRYGAGPRPIIQVANGNIGCHVRADNCLLRALDIRGDQTTKGVSLDGNGHRLEGCSITLHVQGLNVSFGFGVVVYRSNLSRNFKRVASAAGHAQGAYADGASGLTFDTVVFAYNGWDGVNSTNINDLEVFFKKLGPIATPLDLSGQPGALPDGSFYDLNLTGLTISPGDRDLYSFVTAAPEGTINLDVSLSDLNHNGQLDADEKLIVRLRNVSGGTLVEQSYTYTSTPDASGNFHVLVKGQTFTGIGPQTYTVEVEGGPEPVSSTNAYTLKVNIPRPGLVYGNADGEVSEDVIVIVRNARNNDLLDFYLNDPTRTKPYKQINLRTTADIFINGNPQQIDQTPDSITLDFSNGPFKAPRSTSRPNIYLYGGQSQPGAPQLFNSVYIIGPTTNGTMTWDVTGSFNTSFLDIVLPTLSNQTQRMKFMNVGTTQVVDQTAGSLTMQVVNRPVYLHRSFLPLKNIDYALDVNLTPSPLAGHARVQMEAFLDNISDDRLAWESQLRYDFKSKSALTLNCQDQLVPITTSDPFDPSLVAGPTVYNVLLPVVPSALKSLTLVGSPNTVDTVKATGLASVTRVDTATGMLYGVLGAGGALPIKLQGISAIDVVSGLSKSLQIENAATFALTPSAFTSNAGTVTAGSYSVIYEGFGLESGITLKGSPSASLAVYGTSGDEIVTVGNAGTVRILGQAMITTTGITHLTLTDTDGAEFSYMGGNDTFNVPLDPACVFADITVNAVAGLSRLNLFGPGGANTIVLTAVDATLATRTCSFAGIWQVSFTGGSGTNKFAVRGIAGSPEAFTLLAAQSAGTGRILIVAPTAFSTVTTDISFSRVGSASFKGDLADLDTLSVQGTSGVDYVVAKFHTAGTVSDPVLKFQTSKAASLLDLINFTGFSELKLKSLGGNDVINVYSASGAVSRKMVFDGGSGSDVLNVFYNTPPVPTVTRTTGEIEIAYTTANYLVLHSAIETVAVKKKT